MSASEHMESTDGSLSNGRFAWLSGSLETSWFPVVIAVGKSNLGPRRKLKTLGRAIVFLQILGFVFNPSMTWYRAATLHFSAFVYALQIPLWDTNFTGISHAGNAIVVFVVVACLTIYAAVSGWTTRAHHLENSQRWMVRGLERTVRLFSSVLFIPIMRICAAQIACTNVGVSNRLIAFPQENCFDALPVVLMIFAIIYAGAFLASVIILDLLMVEPAYNLKYVDNRATGRVDAVSKLFTAGMVFVAHFLARQHTALAAVFVVYAASNLVLVLVMLPYHRCCFNAAVAAVWGGACGAGVAAIVSAVSSGHIAGSILFYIFTAIGCTSAIPLARMSYNKQTTWLFASGVEIPAMADVEEGMHRSVEGRSSGSLMPVFTRRDKHVKNFCRFDYQLELAIRFLIEEPTQDNIAKAETLLAHQCYHFPSALAEITYAHFLVTFKGDPILARVRINKAKSMEPTIDERMLIKIKETLFEEQRLADAHGGAVTAQSLTDMRKFLSRARHFHVETLRNIADFWRELAKRDVQLSSLPVITSRIESTEHKADEAFEKLLAKFPSSKVVLRSFAQYIEEVKMNTELALEYNAKADMLENVGTGGRTGSIHGSVTGTNNFAAANESQVQPSMESFSHSGGGSSGTGTQELLRRVTASGRLLELTGKLQSGQAVRRLRITACIMLVGFIIYLAVAFSVFYADQTSEKGRLSLYEASGNRTALLMRACYEIRDLQIIGASLPASDPAVEAARLALKRTLGQLEYEHKRASTGLDGTPTTSYEKQKALTFESRVNTFLPVDSSPPGVEQKVVNIIDAGLLFLEHAHNVRQLTRDDFLTIEDDQSFRFVMDNGPGQFRTTFEYSADLLVEEAETTAASKRVTMIALLVAFCLWLNIPGWVVIQSVFRSIREERNFALNLFLLIPKAVIRHLLKEKKYLSHGGVPAGTVVDRAEMEAPECEVPKSPLLPNPKQRSQVTFRPSEGDLSTVVEQSLNPSIADMSRSIYDIDRMDRSNPVMEQSMAEISTEERSGRNVNGDAYGGAVGGEVSYDPENEGGRPRHVAPTVLDASADSGDPSGDAKEMRSTLHAPFRQADTLPDHGRVQSASDSALGLALLSPRTTARLTDAVESIRSKRAKGRHELLSSSSSSAKRRVMMAAERSSAHAPAIETHHSDRPLKDSRHADEEVAEESVPQRESVAETEERLQREHAQRGETTYVGVTKSHSCRAACFRRPGGQLAPVTGAAALWVLVVVMALTLCLQVGVAAPIAMLPSVSTEISSLYDNMQTSATTFVELRNVTERLGELAQIFVATGVESFYDQFQELRRGGRVDALLADIRRLGVSVDGNTVLGTYFEMRGSIEHYRSVAFALMLLAKNITPTRNPMSLQYPWDFEAQTNALSLKSKYPTWKHRFSSRAVDIQKGPAEMIQIAHSCLTSDPYLDDFLLVVHLFEGVHVDAVDQSETSLKRMLASASLLTNVVVAMACAFIVAILALAMLLRVQVVTRFARDELTLRHAILFAGIPVLLIAAASGIVVGVLMANTRLASTAQPASSAVAAVEARANAYYDVMDMTRQARVFAEQGDPKRFTRFLAYVEDSRTDLGMLSAETEQESELLRVSLVNLKAIERYLSIALVLSAAAHGVDPLVTRPLAGLDWDITNETSYESDLVQYPERSPIYSTRLLDMNLNATQQLAIAKTMLYDRKLVQLMADVGTSLDAHREVRATRIQGDLNSLFSFLILLTYVLLGVSIAVILFGFVGFWMIYSSISAHIASKEISIIRQRVEVPSVQKLSRAFSTTALMNTLIIAAFFVTTYVLADFSGGAAWELRQAHQRRGSINAVRYYATELYADDLGITAWNPSLNKSDYRVLEYINFLPTEITSTSKLVKANADATAASNNLLYGDSAHTTDEHFRVKDQMNQLYNMDCASTLSAASEDGPVLDPADCPNGIYTPVHRGTGGLQVLFLRFLAESQIIKNGRAAGRMNTGLVSSALSWHQKASGPINDLLQRSTRISTDELFRRFSLGQSLAISAFVICTLFLVALYFAVAHRGIREISVEETRTKSMLDMIPKDAFNKVRRVDDSARDLPALEPRE